VTNEKKWVTSCEFPFSLKKANEKYGDIVDTHGIQWDTVHKPTIVEMGVSENGI
jgi:hypothetical protein